MESHITNVYFDKNGLRNEFIGIILEKNQNDILYHYVNPVALLYIRSIYGTDLRLTTLLLSRITLILIKTSHDW